MKNKIKSLLLSLFMLTSFSLPSCSKTVSYNERVITKKVQNIDSYVVLRDENELIDISRYDDAVIVVTSEGCSYCQTLYPELKTYIKETENVIYTVDSLIYNTCKKAEYNLSGTYAGLYPTIGGTPTFLFYKEGKIVNTFVKTTVEEDLASVLEPYIYDMNLYQINDFIKDDDVYYQDISEEYDHLGFGTSTLDSKILSDEKLTVLYTYRRCPDCLSYKDEVLYPYLNENKDKKIYFYECDGYYLLKRSENTDDKNLGLKKWSDFCVKYHLSDYPVTDINGNQAGYVPTTVAFDKTTYKIDVFANDGLIARDQDGYLYYSRAFHSKVKELRSTTKVEEGDTTSKTYQKAMKELAQKALEVERELSLSFLRENL